MPEPPSLAFLQRVPDTREVDTVGPIETAIVRGTPAFATLVPCTDQDIVFKDEEGTGADRLMSKRLREKLQVLADLVKNEWSASDLKLRVTDAWDEQGEHAPRSLHYEGRAADLTVSDRDSRKLGRLAYLAVQAGFDWVWYESHTHVHVSIRRDPAEFPPLSAVLDGQRLSQPVLLQDGRAYLPLRALAEALDLDVRWDQATQVAHLTRRKDKR